MQSRKSSLCSTGFVLPQAIAIGVALGFALENLALGLAIGLLLSGLWAFRSSRRVNQ